MSAKRRREFYVTGSAAAVIPRIRSRQVGEKNEKSSFVQLGGADKGVSATRRRRRKRRGQANDATPRETPSIPFSLDGDDEAGQMICCVTSHVDPKRKKKRHTYVHARTHQTHNTQKIQKKKHTQDSEARSSSRLALRENLNVRRALARSQLGCFFFFFFRRDWGIVSTQERQRRRRRMRTEDAEARRKEDRGEIWFLFFGFLLFRVKIFPSWCFRRNPDFLCWSGGRRTLWESPAGWMDGGGATTL